jgi:hypothetical protein
MNAGKKSMSQSIRTAVALRNQTLPAPPFHGRFPADPAATTRPDAGRQPGYNADAN